MENKDECDWSHVPLKTDPEVPALAPFIGHGRFLDVRVAFMDHHMDDPPIEDHDVSCTRQIPSLPFSISVDIQAQRPFDIFMTETPLNTLLLRVLNVAAERLEFSRMFFNDTDFDTFLSQLVRIHASVFLPASLVADMSQLMHQQLTTVVHDYPMLVKETPNDDPNIPIKMTVFNTHPGDLTSKEFPLSLYRLRYILVWIGGLMFGLAVVSAALWCYCWKFRKPSQHMGFQRVSVEEDQL